jgi:4'-phosphopantetheinyl transferase EntD
MEFTAGRTVARLAMRELGLVASGIPQGSSGEPIWPDGVCGSISHTDLHAVALVARRTEFDSVGVDLDDDRLIGDRAARDVTWFRELRLVRSLGLSENLGSAQNFVFSAKEAVFKCQYPLTGYAKLDFRQARLIVPAIASESVLLAVSGWRVAIGVKQVLSRITVTTLLVNGIRIVCALCKRI